MTLLDRITQHLEPTLAAAIALWALAVGVALLDAPLAPAPAGAVEIYSLAPEAPSA